MQAAVSGNSPEQSTAHRWI